jgi:hypothetical protein
MRTHEWLGMTTRRRGMARAVRARCAALLLIPLLACGSDGPLAVETQPDAVQAHARWSALAIDRYTVEMKLACFCAVPYTLWHELRIERDQVVSTRLLERVKVDGMAVLPAPATAFPTVTTLFRWIEAERARPGGFLHEAYDVRTGLPVLVTIGTFANDAGTGYELRNLRPLPAQ